MSSKSRREITDSDIKRVFLEPANPTHRQYEALRAYFVEGIPSAETAARFGYTPGSFRVLCHGFRQDLKRPFFLPVTRGPQTSAKRDTTRAKIVELRKQRKTAGGNRGCKQHDHAHFHASPLYGRQCKPRITAARRGL